MLLEAESLKEKFLRKGFWIYFFAMLTAPLGYIIKIVLTGDLSTKEIGILYSSIGLLGLIGTYTDLGLTESLGYFLPRYILRKSYQKVKLLLATTLIVQITSSIIVGGLLYIFAGWIGEHHIGDPRAGAVIQVMALFFFGIHLLQINTSFFGAIQQTKFQKGIEFFRMFMTMIGVLLVFLLDNGDLLYYTWVWIGGVYLALILSTYLNYTYYYKTYFRSIEIKNDVPLLKEFFRYSLGTLIAANAAGLLHQLDQQLIVKFAGPEEAGIYAIYLSLISIPFLLFSPLISFLFPVISELHEQKKEEKLRMLYTLFNSYFSSFMLWVGGFFFLFGREVSTFFFGSSYVLSGEATRYMAFFLIWNILIQISFGFLAGLGYIRKRITITFITLIVNVILVLLMIWISKNTSFFPSASSGVSVAVGLSWICMWYLSKRVLKKYEDPFNWKLFGWNFIGMLLWGSLVLFLTKEFLYFADVSSRFGAFRVISFAFLIGLVIFLMINKKSLISLIETIRSTKNIIKSS